MLGLYNSQLFSPSLPLPSSLPLPPPPEAELAPKKEPSPGEATALETLLRGEGILEKKKDIKEDETLLEIQVRQVRGDTLRDACTHR